MTELTAYPDYTVHRDGDPNANIAIAFIHGMSAGAWCFEAMAKYFEDKGFCAYRIDLPGHGVRRDSHEPMSLTRYTRASRDFVSEVAQAHERVYVVGHSMGGLITQVLGNKVSVAGIALLAPSPTEGIPFDSFGFGDFAGTLARASKKTLKGGRLIHNHIAQFFVNPDDPVIDVWVKERIFDPISVAARLRYSPPKMQLPKTKDALVIIPKRDIVIKPSTQRKVVDAVWLKGPHTTPIEVPLSHMLVMEQGWEIVAEAIENWVKSC